MFDGESNVQLAGRLLKVCCPTLTVMHVVEHTVLLFLNDVSKIPIVHQMISSHNMIYNMFGSGIYHKPCSVFQQNLKSFKIKTLVFLA